MLLRGEYPDDFTKERKMLIKTSGGAAENNFQLVDGVLKYGTAIKPGQEVEEASMSRKNIF